MRIVLADVKWKDGVLKSLEKSKNTITPKKTLKNTKENLDILLSYWYTRISPKKLTNSNMDSIVEAKKSYLNSKFYVDSGVFTARKKGVIIPPSDLIKFYEIYRDVIDYMFTMDSGEKDQQLKNTITLKTAGLPIIGIWHGLNNPKGYMPYEYIDRILDHTDYIGVGYNPNGNIFEYLDKFFNYIYKKNYWPLKVHALGIERLDILSKYPFYSADSSTFASAYAFGRISYFNKTKLQIKNLHPKDQFRKAFKFDINLIKYIGNTTDYRERRNFQNITPRFEYQKMLTDLWIKKGIDWNAINSI